MKVGSVFSGIGCIDMALQQAGMQIAWQIEIDKTCRRVLAKHWSDVTRYDDVRTVNPKELEPVDLLCGGVPCQPVSIAGQRQGAADSRWLWPDFLRLASALRPAYLLFENPPGLLTMRAAFGGILCALADLGYSGAWTALNSQWFGVAQRRLRIFGLFAFGDSGAQRCAEILSLTHGSGRYSTPSREARAGVAATITSGIGVTGNPPGRRREDDENLIAYQCHGSDVGPMGTLRRGNGDVQSGVPFVAHTLGANAGRNHIEETYIPVVVHTLRAKGADASEDGTGRGVPIIAFNCQSGGDVRFNPSKHLVNIQAHQTPAVLQNWTVRRLTPLECIRLFALPDDWLDLDPPLSDSAKYRLLGNGAVGTVVLWIGQQTMKAESSWT